MRLTSMHIVAVVLLVAGHRNLFQFVEPPPKKTRAAVQRKVTTVVQPQLPVIAQPQAPAAREPEHFPYRCIGRFGPDGDPFAVLDTGGTIINVKAGDLVDGKWRVIGVGLESVTVVQSPDEPQRVPIGR